MGIEMEELPDQMSLSALEARCTSEINNYRRKEPCNDRYCLEIFHRAIVKHNDEAWAILYRRFTGMVLSWLHRHPKWEIAAQCDKEENYVAKTFARFWQATTHSQVEFDSLAAAFSYLQACLNGAILDTLRAHARPNLTTLPEPGYPEEPATEEVEDEGQEIWEAIRSLLPNEREQRLAYLLFHCGLKAREVVQRCRNEFSDVREVYRLRRNIMERLMRNADQLRWRLSSDE